MSFRRQLKPFYGPVRWQKIGEAVAFALEIPIEKRVEWLDAFCAGDGELKSEIESLLACSTEAGDFLEQSLASLAAKILPENQNDFAGKQFGHYRIEREIGRGGMGAVFLAERSDGEFDQQVALKIVRQTIFDSESENRFRRERQILASLNHPNIAKLLDGGVSEAGEPFLAMEFIEGETLLEFAARENLPIEKRLRLFLKICAAVAFAHRNLTVHRDIKPSNIIVTGEGEPKLLDFGLAKLSEPTTGAAADGLTRQFERLANFSTAAFEPPAAANNSELTQTVFHAMTPAYASPEQLRGENVTTASDVYSLGVVLYELLTGNRPYNFKTDSFEEMVRLVSTIAPLRPSSSAVRSESKARSPKSKPPKTTNNEQRTTNTPQIQNLKSLKGDLDSIVLKSLRKKPEQRYASVEQFSEDINCHLNGFPISARPNTFGYRAGKFVKRNKISVSVGALLILSLVVGIIATVWQARAARNERVKAEVVNGFLQNLLSASNPETELSRKNGHDTTVKELLDEASKRLETEDLSNQPEVKAELQRIIGTSYLAQGDYASAEKNLDKVIETQTKIYGENSLETLKTMVVIGDLWLSKGDNAKADKFYGRRIEILRAEHQKGNINADYLFAALYDFALLRRAQGDSKAAENLLREALDWRSETSSEMKNNVGIAESVLALTLSDQGKFDEAEKIARAKLGEIQRQANTETPEFCGALTMLGSVLTEKGAYDESEKNLLEAETLYRKLYRQTYLPLGDNLRLQAQTLYFQDKLPEAEAKINETLEIYRKTTSAQYINYPTALTVQGLIFNSEGKSDEAEKVLREAVRIRAENLPKENFLRASAVGALGECLMTQKRFAEAEPLLLESRESLKNSQGADNPRTKIAQQRVEMLYENWEKTKAANKIG